MVETVEKVIICNPYKEPTSHWKYEDGKYERKDGRRHASYRIMDKTGVYGKPVRIESVDYIRSKVDEWRKENYPDVSNVTCKLLDHWNNLEEPRLFFCQLEAIETIIYLNEINQDLLNETPGFDFEKNGTFERLCSKMATGTGKTIIIGMVIAWQVLNSMHNKNQLKNQYTKNILVITPSLIVLDRLQVLYPSNDDNIYDEFKLIPDEYKKNNLKMTLKITNWHKLKPKGKPHKISKIGNESPKTLTTRIFDKKNNIKNILVINDEGHHAYRSENYIQSKGGYVKDDHAGIWMNGLDLINQGAKIKTCYDFSATPFVSVGKSMMDESLFTWIISDFSLDDAVESGLIKTPKVSYGQKDSLDNGRIYTEDDVRKAFKSGKIHENIEHAYKLLTDDWKATYTSWKNACADTDPVLITVCNETKHAELIDKAMTSNSMALPEELCNKESILHIDSARMKRIEEGTEKKSDYTLRDQASSVGRKGMPGEKINNVISVSMLTEGWDAKTVTHIMGLRAFTSQLLCEQVIGRGLRRTSYELNDDGLFSNEYVTIFGVPHGFLPVEGGKCKKCNKDPCECPKPPPPKEIRVVEERTPCCKISWPIVNNINKEKKYFWEIKGNFTPYILTGSPPTDIEMKILIDGIAGLSGGSIKNKNIHVQQVEFKILHSMFNKLAPKWKQMNEDMSNIHPHDTIVDLLDLIKKFLQTSIISDFKGNDLFNTLFYQHDKIASHLLRMLDENPRMDEKFKADITYGYTDTRKSRFTQSKYVSDTVKTHLDKMVGHNQFELDIGAELDDNKNVLSWIKADMVNFNIKYEDADGKIRNYRPDFIVHLNNGVNLILEGKGEERPDVKYKTKATKEWIKAVNDSSNGQWSYKIVWKDEISDRWLYELRDVLANSYKVTHVCRKCNKKETDAKNAANLFKVFNDDGILRYDQVCKTCRLKSL